MTRHLDRRRPGDTLDTSRVRGRPGAEHPDQEGPGTHQPHGTTTVGMSVSGQVTFDDRGRPATRGQPIFDVRPSGRVRAPGRGPEPHPHGLRRPVADPQVDRSRRQRHAHALRFEARSTGETACWSRSRRQRQEPQDLPQRADEVLAVEEFNTIGGTLWTLLTRYQYDPLSRTAAGARRQGQRHQGGLRQPRRRWSRSTTRTRARPSSATTWAATWRSSRPPSYASARRRSTTSTVQPPRADRLPVQPRTSPTSTAISGRRSTGPAGSPRHRRVGDRAAHVRLARRDWCARCAR